MIVEVNMSVSVEARDDKRIFSAVVRGCDILMRVYMRLVSYIHPIKQCKTIYGASIECRSRDLIQRRIRYFGIFEHNLTYFTVGALQEGDVYVDIGANIGYFTLLASFCVGNTGRVVSIEADPNTFRKLQANVTTNHCSNVILRNVAVTESRCRVAMRREAYNSGANSIMVTADGEVDGLPFQDLVAGDLERARFIKIDVEGSEGPILRTIISLSSKLSDDLIVASEISPTSTSYVLAFVKAGFKAYAIPNVYEIDYYLIRSYLALYADGENYNLIPVTEFNKKFRDYVFVRGTRPASA